MKTFPAVLVAIFFLTGCAAVKPAGEAEQVERISLQYIEGTVQSISGNEVVLSLKLPEFKKTPDIPISEIAQQVIQKSLFLEGIKTDINGIPAVIKEVRGNVITAAFEKAPIFSSGAAIKLQIPKKIIAITDFEVIKGREKEAGRVTLEGLTSALIDSGHFTVVERSKLKIIMDELQLSLSGLTKETPEKVLGRLFMADIILTGTLADISGVWDINLRLVNVRTGHAMAAIAMRMPLFKPTELRDASAFNEDFEGDAIIPSWNIGYRKTDKGFYSVSFDRNTGAEGSKSSLKIDFDFPDGIKPSFARIENRMKRDLSFYSGIEFYIKATEKLAGAISFKCSHPEDIYKVDSWVGMFEIDTNWKNIRIPFEHLRIGGRWIKEGAAKEGFKIGDQILRLDRFESVRIGVDSAFNPPVKGTVWIDKVRFYR